MTALVEQAEALAAQAHDLYNPNKALFNKVSNFLTEGSDTEIEVPNSCWAVVYGEAFEEVYGKAYGEWWVDQCDHAEPLYEVAFRANMRIYHMLYSMFSVIGAVYPGDNESARYSVDENAWKTIPAPPNLRELAVQAWSYAHGRKKDKWKSYDRTVCEIGTLVMHALGEHIGICDCGDFTRHDHSDP
jgi:hypothetical protein